MKEKAKKWEQARTDGCDMENAMEVLSATGLTMQDQLDVIDFQIAVQQGVKKFLQKHKII